jgi:hypothetical protein
MKRPWIIIFAGLAFALAGYLGVYHITMSCCGTLATAPNAKLAWLKEEFHLGDAEFQRISDLHQAYTPACRARCERIDAKNAELRALLAKSAAVTPEVERALVESAELRSDCQVAMLRHFVEVSRVMPPEAGRRYLDWVCARTLGSSHATMSSGDSGPVATTNEHPGH